MRIKITKIPLPLCILLLLFLIISCSKPMKIGLLTNLESGTIQGSSEVNAANLFIEEQNRKDMELLPLNDQWLPEQSKAMFTKAVKEGVQFIITSHSSTCAVPLLDLPEAKKALSIITASTSDRISKRDDFFLRVISDVKTEQKAIAEYISRLAGSSLLMIRDIGNPEYTDPAKQYFLDNVKDKTLHLIELDISSFSYEDVSAQIQDIDYDIVYLLAGTFQVEVGNLAQLVYIHRSDVPIILTPWVRSPSLIPVSGPAIDNMILASEWPSRTEDPKVDAFFHRFHTRFGYEPLSMSLGVYTAMELLSKAFDSGATTPAAVKDFLLKNSPFQTTLTTVDFDEYGDYTGQFYFISNLRVEFKE